ncbi:hypothetical protein LINPERPRIM_LOCUS22089, partial [Linum perenne]
FLAAPALSLFLSNFPLISLSRSSSPISFTQTPNQQKKGTNHHLPPDRRNIIAAASSSRAAIIIWSGAPPSSSGAERRHLLDSDLTMSVPMHVPADPSRVEVTVCCTRPRRSPSPSFPAVAPSSDWARRRGYLKNRTSWMMTDYSKATT